MSSSTRFFYIFIKSSFSIVLWIALFSFFVFECHAQKTETSKQKKNNNKANYSYQKPVKKRITALQARATSLTVDLPFALVQNDNDYVQTLGFWHMLTDRLNLGMNFGLSLDQADVVTREAVGGEPEERTQQTQTEFIFSPGFKYYTRNQSKVALFFLSQLHLRSYNDGDTQTVNNKKAAGEQTYNPEEDLQLSGTLAFGAEWFPVKSFSLGWHVGINMHILRQGWQGFALDTYTSAIKAHIYF